MYVCMYVFVLQGMDAVFRVALAILLDKREQLLKLDMPGMMNVCVYIHIPNMFSMSTACYIIPYISL